MKFTLTWLKQHLDTTASLTEICDKLTALGLEVESVQDRGKALAPFIIAEVLTAEKHPQADRLKVTTVNTGKEKLQVVCGAPNCRAGLKAVLARPGDVMPDSGEALKKGVIRGVESNGMLCAMDELGLGSEHAGIIELPADAPVGESYAKYAKLDDAVIEINLTPNRPDCAGVYGIARDLAAAGLGKLKPLDIKPIKGKEPSRIKVKLDFAKDNKSCPLFVGRLIRNVKNGPSPTWLQQYLQAIGLRPISALVDITNFMTIDADRPLHVFDAAKLKGNLRVYPAKGGEILKALNGKEYKLEAGMTAIADDKEVVSLGGIMGGETTGCTETTTDVYIEAAYFDPIRTTRTGRALQISSDARYRFERGIDPAFTISGAEMATQLILDLCGTQETIVSDLEIAGEVPINSRTIALDLGKCKKHVGVDVPEADQTRILTALGFIVTKAGAQLSVTTPSWRPDVEGAADLVEEIIRVKGYDAIMATSLPHPGVVAAAIDVQDQRLNAARRALASQGLMEAVTWSFMPSNVAERFGPIDDNLRLKNPISSDLDVMRPSILGNLIMAAKRNADRGFEDSALFEVGPVYKNPTLEGQETVATSLRAGQTPRHWAEKPRAVDAFDAKADAIAALAAAGAPVASLQVTADAPGWYHPGRSGVLRLGPAVLATFGEIHPGLLMACDASGPMAGSEIFIANIPQSRSAGTAKPLLKLDALQAVGRDFAFVVGRDVTAAKLIQAVKGADKNLIRDVSVFDIYEGEKVGADKKSVALSVTLQPTDKTLTDAEIEAIATRITAAVTKATGAVLRG
ncbi:MAG TPA: phenylalanine--tRNA ligase subunit beta [Alphaproteobacteria bacterium]|nr:phenylalanine--tRNA ligase subunit beta [Alphaproteobacteria bacterium]